jgi:hypothetical protein
MAWNLFFQNFHFCRNSIDKNGGKEREREREITLLKSMLDGYGIFTRVSGRFQGRRLKTSLPTMDFNEN